jgi:hypothetical protein
MSRQRHILHTLKNRGEVRHLLLDATAGTGATKLSKLINSVETSIDSGTQYNMEQKAIEVAKNWIQNEGFKFPGEHEHVFDTLENTLALVTYMGFKHVQDARYKNFTPGQRPNIGICSLAEWPGMKPKNYVYAFDGIMTIFAVPWTPPTVVINTPQDIIAAAKMQDAIGPSVSFILGGD